ncbi:MAG: alpha/beta fold hydrolase [Gammaproteobacteria bacterium]|nr:alpha/beta fold hydrolase [Gammaproteobacteria bacterium]
MSRQNVSFPNAQGEQLAGVLETPATVEPRACALFAHCFTCTKNIRAAIHISRSLVDAGFAVLRFDFTGLGESEGDFGSSGFSANVADLVAAADFLEQHVAPPGLLIGHSLGGLAALYAAPRIESCVAVVTLGAPARADHVQHLFAGGIDEIRAQGEATVEIAGRPFRLSKSFLDDLLVEPPALQDLNRALLVMHSPVDTIVGIDNASEIFLDARHPKSFVSLDSADHLLGNPQDSAYAAGVIAAWADRYLPATAAAAGRSGETVTAVTGAGSFRTAIDAAGHSLIADEPASVGGEDTGPTPYGLLSAALAACTSMTLQMYARRKKILLDEAAVSIRHEKIHADDCESCESSSGRIDRFDKEIRLTGELTSEQRARMLEIADMCPVHRTLHSEVEVRSKLAD